MSYLLKDPAAVLDYAVDWGAEHLSKDALLTRAIFEAGAWEIGKVRASSVSVAGNQVVGAR